MSGGGGSPYMGGGQQSFSPFGQPMGTPGMMAAQAPTSMRPRTVDGPPAFGRSSAGGMAPPRFMGQSPPPADQGALAQTQAGYPTPMSPSAQPSPFVNSRGKGMQ